MRYALLYMHRFGLRVSHRITGATAFHQLYHRYEDVQTVADRLRWCRYSKGLLQSEVAEIAGVSRAVYMDAESGSAQQIPLTMVEKLATFYGVLITDFLDEYNRFLYDGQAVRIRAYREATGMRRKPFAREMGIPIRSLQDWESGAKTLSRKSWERYFKEKA